MNCRWDENGRGEGTNPEPRKGKLVAASFPFLLPGPIFRNTPLLYVILSV